MYVNLWFSLMGQTPQVVVCVVISLRECFDYFNPTWLTTGMTKLTQRIMLQHRKPKNYYRLSFFLFNGNFNKMLQH